MATKFIFLLALAGAAFSQAQRGVITGTIVEAARQTPIAFANVILFNRQDSVMVTGTASGESGSFRIDGVTAGDYYLDIQFIGYKKRRFDKIVIGSGKFEFDLGKISMQQTALSMAGVEVQGEPVVMNYQIDKKVINVDQQQTAISGTAVDVLENVPAVRVDIEGNVSLRGSGNFTLLIDGRPSVLEPSEALQQIPASTIENIEIITNPSAKYDPEGAAGIINVILKKDWRAGRSGIANLNAGSGNKYGGDLLYDHKNENYQTTFSVDYNSRLLVGDEREENQTTHAGLTSFIESAGNSQRKDVTLGARGELKLDLGPKDVLSLGGRYGRRDSQRGTNLNYTEWSEPANEKQLYTSISDRFRDRNFYALMMFYQHRFAPKGHELSAEMFFRGSDSEEATTNGLWAEGENLASGRRTTEAGPSRDLRMRLDYTLSWGPKAKFEAGYLSDFDFSDENTGLYEYDTGAGDYILLPQFSNRTRFDDNVHALYALHAGAWGRSGYQLGLRGEYTDRTIIFDGAEQPFRLGAWDYFPTLHFSHEFSAGQQAMMSYTRRIDRPNGGDLEPFQTWVDAYNVHVGNPALQSEYIDSYEIGYQTPLGSSLISAEAYYRETHNRIEDVRSVYADNVTLHSVANIGKEYTLGSELAWNFDPNKKWNVNVTGNLYDYRITGALFGEALDRKSFNWSARMSNKIKLSGAAQIQLDGIYDSPSISPQGRREGYFMANAAVKYEIFGKLLSATLQVRDVFGSAKREAISQGADFYNYRFSTREAPVMMLNLKYNFNNFKSERERNRVEPGEENDF